MNEVTEKWRELYPSFDIGFGNHFSNSIAVNLNWAIILRLISFLSIVSLLIIQNKYIQHWSMLCNEYWFQDGI